MERNNDNNNNSEPPAPPLLETIHLEHVPPTHTIHVAVFRNVTNSAFLHRQLLSRNTDFQYAFVDASAVVSCRHVLSAVFKAVTADLAGDGLRTPNIHSETVCSLSPNNNIAEAYRHYGITPESKNLIIIKILISSSPSSSAPTTTTTTTATTGEPTKTRDDVQRHLEQNVRGDPLPFNDDTLARFTDWAKVRKYYKLNNYVTSSSSSLLPPKKAANGVAEGRSGKGKSSSGEKEEEEDGEIIAARRKEMEMLILGSMALRGV